VSVGDRGSPVGDDVLGARQVVGPDITRDLLVGLPHDLEPTVVLDLTEQPPFLFCSAISMSMVSLSVDSLLAMLPDRGRRMPTLIVSAAAANAEIQRASPARAAAVTNAMAVPDS